MNTIKKNTRMRARACSTPQRKIQRPYLDRYLPLEPCGTGGTSRVYRAQDLDTGCFVAIKLMPRPRDWQRVGREIEALQSIEHPNIVRMLDFGFDRDHDHVVLVMELLDGMTLDALLHHHPRLPWRASLLLALAVLDGLVCIHDHGLVHRDIKPSNLVVTDDRRSCIKIIDFGVVKPLDDRRRITEFDTIIGTPAYMPPEQQMGLRVGSYADVYALGQVLLQMLSGQAPRDRGLNDVSVKMTFSPRLPHDATRAPESVEAIIRSMLDPMPARRPTSARHCAEIIRRALHVDGVPKPRSDREDTVRLFAARESA